MNTSSRRSYSLIRLAAVRLIVLVFPFLSVHAEDDIVAKAKAYVQQATAHADKWNGPATGPKAQASKNIICVLSDSLNGGVKGVADGLAEAAIAIGWNFRVIDGRGEVEGRRKALEQAIELRPEGIVINGFDAKEQQTLIDRANAQRIDIVGWHAAATPGPLEKPQLFVNVTTRQKKPLKQRLTWQSRIPTAKLAWSFLRIPHSPSRWRNQILWRNSSNNAKAASFLKSGYSPWVPPQEICLR